MGDLAPITGNRQPTAATPPAITAPARRLSPEPNSTLRTPNSKFPAPPPVIPAKAGNHAPPPPPSPTQPRAATNPIPEITQIKRITVQDQAATTIRGQWASATSGATRGLGATCCPWRFGGCVDSGFRRKDVRMGRGLRGFRLSPERREDGEGVAWIPAFAGKT